MKDKLCEVCHAFGISGDFLDYDEIKMGNINRTFRVSFAQENGETKAYIVQRVNTHVFKNPEQVMENIDRVTEHIRTKKSGQIALHFHHTRERKTYLYDQDGFWRLFNFIPSVTYNACENLDVVRNAGQAFGQFQMQLSDFDAGKLHETIPDFHNTSRRYETLEKDVLEDPLGRAAEVKEELDYLFSVREEACRLTRMHDEGLLPLRVTHNDTKINNVLFDPETHQALAVIDLDTVMPGLVGHDFGDAIRFAANHEPEDSPRLDRVGCNMEVFQAFAEGFLQETAHTLTAAEADTLALSCFVLTVELAVRFLDDYLLGDPYFKINYPEHNAVRTRCQIALARDMQRKMPQMEKIVRCCMEKYR